MQIQAIGNHCKHGCNFASAMTRYSVHKTSRKAFGVSLALPACALPIRPRYNLASLIKVPQSFKEATGR